MKKNQLVRIKRDQLAPSLAACLPSFIFWNEGKVSQVSGNRVCVRWPGSQFWFDSEAVK